MQSASKLIYRGKLLGSLPTVGEIHKEIAVSEETATWISLQRDIIANILLGKDPRLLVIVVHAQSMTFRPQLIMRSDCSYYRISTYRKCTL